MISIRMMMMMMEQQQDVMIVLATAIVGAVITLIAVYYMFFAQHKIKLPPGVDPFPVVRSGYLETTAAVSGNRAPWWLVDQMKELGPNFLLRLPVDYKNGGVFVVGNPKAAREILCDPKADKPPAIYNSFNILKKGYPTIFSSPNNAYWKHVRKEATKAFKKEEVERMNAIAHKLAERLIEQTLEPLVEKGGTFEPYEVMNELTFRVICEAAFEYEPTVDVFELFEESNLKAQLEFAVRQRTDPMRAYLRYINPEVRQAHKYVDNLMNISQMVLDKYEAKPDKSPNQTVIRLIHENESLNSNQRRAEVGTMLSAGYETTGNTLGAIFYNLAKFPDITLDLRSRLRALDPKDWTKCSLMQQIIKESNRLMTVAPMIMFRSTSRDFIIEEGDKKYMVPTNAIVTVPHIVLHQNERVFSNPELFDPYRWDPDKVTVAMNEAHSLMFAAGPRNCVGQALALAEINTVLPLLVMKYDFILEDPGKPDFFLTFRMAHASVKILRAES